MLIAHVLRDKGAVVYTVRAEATLEEAAGVLTEKKVGALVVIGEGGAIVGVMSERDIVREIARNGGKSLSDTVATIMSRDVVTADPTETVDEGLGRMTERRIRHLPVLDSGRLIGVVSIGDLVKDIISEQKFIIEQLEHYITGERG